MAQQVPFVCPFCDACYEVSKDLVGRATKCRNCYELCRVSGPKRPIPRKASGSHSLAVNSKPEKTASFLTCIGKAILKTLIKAIPFGNFALDIFEDWSNSRNEEERRQEMQAIAEASNREFHDQVVATVQKLAPTESKDIRKKLTACLSQLQSKIHDEFRRPSDLTGTTIPPSISLDKADDLIPFLPTFAGLKPHKKRAEAKTSREPARSFTERARKVMQLANQEAQRVNHEYIGTGHILLGLVKEGSGVAATVLKQMDIDLRKIRLEVEKIRQAGSHVVTMGRLPESPRVKKVIEYSIEEAHNLDRNNVATEHLLLGLLRDHKNSAAQVLINLGLNPKHVRREVLEFLGVMQKKPIGDNPRDASVYIGRARASKKKGNYEQAIRDYTEAIRLDPNHHFACNNLAWLLATCPNEEFRNGKKAVELAKQACELTDWKYFSYIDTLAAASAEVGDFENAVKYQLHVLQKPSKRKKDYGKRFELYKQKKAYRTE